MTASAEKDRRWESPINIQHDERSSLSLKMILKSKKLKQRVGVTEGQKFNKIEREEKSF